jgi:hypothetical protein
LPLRKLPALALCGFGALLFGCPAGDGPARSEAAAVSRGIEALRNADNAQKSAPLAALRALPCSVADVCAVQSLCVAAYEGHVQALALIERVKATARTAPVETVQRSLTEAERALERAKQGTDDCATKQGELVRKYRVR